MPEYRERLYPPTVVLSKFMRQVLEADSSCPKAVTGWTAQRAADRLAPCSVRTGGFCRERERQPMEMVSTLARETGRLLSEKALAQWLWRGRAVKLVVLRAQSVIAKPPQPVGDIADELRRYDEHMDQARGLSAGRRRGRVRNRHGSRHCSG